MRIAYIDHASELGGGEHLLLRLLSGLASSAISPVLICGNEGPFPEKARRLGIGTEIVTLPKFHSSSIVIGRTKIFNPFAILKNVLALLRSARLMKSVLQIDQVQIVQTNSAFAHIYGGLAARSLRIPCIWYFHDLIETNRLGGIVVLVWKILARVLATRVVATSRAVAGTLGSEARCSVIYAGQKDPTKKCSAEGFRSALGLSEKTILVGYVGRIAYVKGLDNLVDAAVRIAAVNDLVHFLLVGEPLFGEFGFKQRVIRMVEDAGLNNKWHWLGYDPEVRSKLPQLDLMVLPSRREALGLVLLDGAMAERAVVATRVGGIPEVVVDGETGILVQPDNPEELADAVLRLVDNPKEASEMGRKARQRITSLFSLPRYYEEFDQLYHSLAGAKRNP